MHRQEANFQIVGAILKAIKKYPDWRFGQLLINLNLIEDYDQLWFEESTKMLHNINNKMITNEGLRIKKKR